MKKHFYYLLAVLIPSCAPASQRFDTITRAQMIPTTQDVAAVSGQVARIEAKTNVWNALTGQVARIEARTNVWNALTGQVARIEARTNVWNALTGQVATVSGQVARVEARTNVWNTAYGWGDHAGLYLGMSAWSTASNDLWQGVGNRLATSVFTGWTNTQHSINTNLAERIDELESAVVFRSDLDGGWFYPDWFAWSFSQVADGVPDTTTISTNSDVVLQTSVYSALGGSWLVTYSGVRAVDFSSPAVTSASPSVATCALDKVWYVSAGTATVSATIGDFTRTTNLTMELVASLTNEAVIGCVTGSAVCAFATGIDSRLTDGTDKAVYSTQDHTATNYVRNANSWVADIDLTCVSPWNSTGGRTRAGTLIGSDCIIFANHFQISTGATVRFITSSNTVVARTMQSRMQVGASDFMLGRLSGAISTNECRPCLLEPADFNEFMTSTTLGYNNLRPVLWIDQYENAYVADSPLYGSISPSTDATRMLYNKTPIINDSGSPAFFIANGQPPVLLTTMYSTLGGFPIGQYASTIRSTASALGCATNTIVEADFAAMGFTKYSFEPPTF